MSFTFHLQQLLDLREQHTQARARELALAQQVATAAARAEEMLAAVRANSYTAMQSVAGTGPRVGELHQRGTVLALLDERLIEAGNVCRVADVEVHKAQALLAAAARDRRVLDRLRDHHAGAWLLAEAAKDRLQMDEAALLQFARKQENERGGVCRLAPP